MKVFVTCPDALPRVLQPYYDIPDFMGSDAPSGLSDDDPIDLVFVDFIEDQLLEILNGVQSDKTHTEDDVKTYTPVLASEAMGLFAQKVWN